MAAVPKSVTSSAVNSTIEHPIVTEPLKPLNTDPNVKILRVEKFSGNVAALRERSSNPSIPIQSALITPGGHLRRNHINKENEVDLLLHDENICDQNLSSDTLSMSGLLSSSKVQGNSTKTSLDNYYKTFSPVISKHPVISSTETTNSVSQKVNLEITPTNSPTRNRKRTRSNERTPTNCFTPPMIATALDVYYNSKHRLTPSPRTQSNSSTPDTPRSNSNLDVLYNSKHRLTPSPNRSSKDQTTESSNSTPVTPVASLHNSNGLHSTHSTNFLGPSNSNIRHFDNIRSPRLLAQSNSQFSSVSDLREFAIKSSQSVISWPSQKLRTPCMKQFTIKNIGGKKLTMKIEVIGPGFQVSDGKNNEC